MGYGGKAGRYYCHGALVNHGTARCISFGGLRADNVVGAEVLRVLKPLGIDAAVRALAAQTGEISAAQRQLELALQEAHFAATYARRQYDAVDPANRLVASELERRWNEALQVVHRLEGEIAELEAKKPAPLGEKERRLLMRLGADLELAWSHPAATAETRKRILRTALHEIVARRSGLHQDGPALAGRRPHAAAAEGERSRQASLGRARGYIIADPRVGAPDARPANRAASQSRRQADWTR